MYQRSIAIMTAFFILTNVLISQNEWLQSGPMLGPMALRDATIWLQTKESANVLIDYRIKGSNEAWKTTLPMTTSAEHGYTSAIHLIHLLPGTTYEYQIKINNQVIRRPYPLELTTQTLWQFRTDPPDFKFIAGSCSYINDIPFDRPGKSYGGEYEIFKSMHDEKPEFMVWLGDNDYLREVDYDSRSGIYYRYTNGRSVPELQPYLASKPNYAIWDDHDYGPNDSDWTYPLKNHTLQAFKDFWPSESYGAGHTDGITNGFMWNDCQFFMLDNRWYRTSQSEDGTILGEQQKYWLKESLLSSKAAFKFVCVGGQFLSDLKGFENFANYSSEREELIQFIDENKIKNVIFLTGDRHHSEITKLTTNNGVNIYDVTTSPLTSTSYDHSSEVNTLRVSGSLIGQRNYAVFEVSGGRKNRKLNVIFKDTFGKVLYQYSFE